MPEHRYQAYISYSHADEQWAIWLQEALEGYRLPKRVMRDHALTAQRIFPVFRDRVELASAHSLSGEVEKALEDSAALIVVCSPAAADSEWVGREIEYFHGLGRSARVFCLLVGDPATSFPQPLLQSEDTAGKVLEPLAADPRPQADGKRGALLKLVAGLLELTFDDLARRDRQRTLRRRAAAGLLSVAGVAMVLSLLQTAKLARDEADAQRKMAMVQQTLAAAEADKSQATNNFLRDMLLASDPEFGDGEATTRHVLDWARTNIDTEFRNQPEIKAEVLWTIGRAYLSLGDYPTARELLTQSLEIRVDLFRRRAPDDQRVVERTRSAGASHRQLRRSGTLSPAEHQH